MEAELVHLREELTEARGLREVAERERQEAVRLLQVDLIFEEIFFCFQLVFEPFNISHTILQDALRKAASATAIADTQNERVGEVLVVNGATSPDETENNFEHKTEDGCEEAESGCDAKGLEKRESCESREQKTTVASNRDTGASKPTKDVEKQDIVERQALVSRNSVILVWYGISHHYLNFTL